MNGFTQKFVIESRSAGVLEECDTEDEALTKRENIIRANPIIGDDEIMVFETWSKWIA